MHDTITYEQPLNELMRVCLRLEHLFQQVDQNINGDDVWSSRQTMAGMLEVLNVIDRTDIKMKLTKALSQQAAGLAILESSPDVDSNKLQIVLRQLDGLIDQLHAMHGKLGNEFQTHDFLNTIRMRLKNPGGACHFSIPSYHLWLQKPAVYRRDDLRKWYHVFDMLKAATELLLELTRQNGVTKAMTSDNGFFQQSLDPQSHWQLIRVTVDASENTYPEISLGRHRLSVHFFSPDEDCQPKRVYKNIPFKLTCCASYGA